MIKRTVKKRSYQMKLFSIFVSLMALLLSVGPVHADCGKSHGKENPHQMGRISNTDFADIDADKDGSVSFDEFKAVFPKTSQAGFNMLDKDGDARLNETEWEAFKDAHKGMGQYKQAPETT